MLREENLGKYARMCGMLASRSIAHSAFFWEVFFDLFELCMLLAHYGQPRYGRASSLFSLIQFVNIIVTLS